MNDLSRRRAPYPGHASALHDVVRGLIPLVDTAADLLQHLPAVPLPWLPAYSGIIEQIARLVNEIIAGSAALSNNGQPPALPSPAATPPDPIPVPDPDWEAAVRDFYHDLRSGLGLINSLLYLLGTKDITDSERQSFLEILGRNVLSVQRLIKNFIPVVGYDARPAGPESAGQ